MTRIIAGKARGCRLRVPAGNDTRPTSDRVREALFSRLEHDGWLDGTRVLDLYAGSGALGLEAASRGAAAVLLVEQARPATTVISHNMGTTRLTGLRLSAGDVSQVLSRPADTTFDLALIDPPYPLGEAGLAAVLQLLVDGGWLAERALVVVERQARSPQPGWPHPLTTVDQRCYGETRLWFAEQGEAG